MVGAVRGDAARISEIAGRCAALPNVDARLAAFRTEVRDAFEGQVPASAVSAYVEGLARCGGPAAGRGAVDVRAAAGEDAALRGQIRAERRHVGKLEGRLEALEASNRTRFDASRRAFQAQRDQLAKVLTNRRVHGDDRMGAFFQIAQKNDQEAALVRSFKAYEVKAKAFAGELAELRAIEAELDAAPAAAGGPEATIVRLLDQQASLQALLTNLQSQVELLETMGRHASGVNGALRDVQRALEAETAQTKAWIEQAQSANFDAIASYMITMGRLFAAAGAGPGVGLGVQVASWMKDILLEDVDGLRGRLEGLVWRTLGRFAIDGLIDAGVGKASAKAVVDAIRTSAKIVLDERQSAEEAAAAADGAALTGPQRKVIDFLLRRASDALPLASLVKAALRLHDMTEAQADEIVRGLGALEGPGLTEALATLERAAA